MIGKTLCMFSSVSTGKRVLLSFSAIGNTAKLLSTKQKPTEIHCLHGMRFMSMSWVLLFHAFLLPSNYTGNSFPNPVFLMVLYGRYLYSIYLIIGCRPTPGKMFLSGLDGVRQLPYAGLLYTATAH